MNRLIQDLTIGLAALLVAALVVLRPAIGQEAPAKAPQTFGEVAAIACSGPVGPYTEVQRILPSEYGEQLKDVWPLPENLGGRLEGWVNPNTGSWTTILVFPDGKRACGVQDGVDPSLKKTAV